MARAKKTEEQSKDEDSTSLQISIEDFVRTRDSVSCVDFIRLSRSSSEAMTALRCVHEHGPKSHHHIICAKSMAMGGSSRCLSREEVTGALRSSLDLLKLPFCNVCEIARQLAEDMIQGAMNPIQAHLTFTPQVVTGLATLQSAVQDLSRAYIAHTNTVIGKGNGSSLELLNFANPLGGENGLFNSGRVATPAPAPAPEQGEVKKRKRAPHDKNAPKRPVTPYFLYMSFAREGIAKSMGSGTTAKQVAEEGTRRWNTMEDEEKQVSTQSHMPYPQSTAADRAVQLWQGKYGANYAAYKEKVKAYKAGLPIPEFSPEETQQLYDEQRKTGAAPAPIPEATPDHDEKSDSEEEGASDATSSEEESPEPPKAVSPPKSPRASKRGKGAKEKVMEKTPLVKEAPTALKTPTMDKKKTTSKKRDAKVIDEVPEPNKQVQASGSSPAKSKKETEPKPKRKKRKSEAADT